MEWPRQSYRQSQFTQFFLIHRRLDVGRKLVGSGLALAASLIILSAPALAAESGGQASRDVGPEIRQSLQHLSDEELSRISASGMPDRLFDRWVLHASHGNAVEVIGDMAALLNPLVAMLDPETTFRNAIFNPANPAVLVDRNGAYMLRITEAVGPTVFRNNPGRGPNGAGMGAVEIHGLERRGTTVIYRTR